MKRVALHTLGCKLNYAETASIGKQFIDSGYKIVEIEGQSDIVVINSCSVTSNAERECRQIIRRALRYSPDAFVAVIGCYAQVQGEQISKISGVDFIWGSGEKGSLAEIITDKFEKRNITVDRKLFKEKSDRFTAASSAGYEERTRAFIKVQDGCDYNCSYCIVPIARGRGRSASLDEVIVQANEAVDKNYKEIVLTGVNVGEYGKDENNLLMLLKRLVKIDGLARIRITSIEPNLLTSDLLDFWLKEEKLCNHWHIPLQSGSDEILGRMKRRYKTELYKDRIEKIKSCNPDAGIGTDVIVGFPGETEQLFDETYEFLNLLPLSYFHVFSYSERPETLAVNYEHKVEPKIKKERCRKLRELGLSKKRSFHKRFIDRTVPVLFESEHSGGIFSGLTEEYIRVDSKSESNIKNSILKVKILNCLEERCIGQITEVK